VWDPDRNEYRYIEIQTFTPEVPLPATGSAASAATGPTEHGGHGEPGSHGAHGAHGSHGAHGMAPAEIASPRLDDALADFDGGAAALAQVRHRADQANAMVGHAHDSTSVRAAEHNGHTIEIITTYELRINGEALTGHLGVNADGTVHYHGVPNYATESAIDLAKQIVDSFPDDYARTRRPSRPRRASDVDPSQGAH